MKILDAKIEWMERYSNLPGLKILVDKMPKHEDLRYEKRGNFYYAELDGYVSFYFWAGRQDKGFAGRHFNITMLDGTEVILKGPWSSNSASVNNAGFKECMEISITDDPAVMERGHTFYASAITIDSVKHALKEFLPEICLFKGKYGYFPAAVNDDGQPIKPMVEAWKPLDEDVKLVWKA